MGTRSVATKEVTITPPHPIMDGDDVVIVATFEGCLQRIDGDPLRLLGVLPCLLDFAN
jgi:hypothetical protein